MASNPHVYPQISSKQLPFSGDQMANLPAPTITVGKTAARMNQASNPNQNQFNQNLYQVPTLSPQQSDLQNQLLQLLGPYLQQNLQGLTQNPNDLFAPIEENARNQFAKRTLPSIAERFAQSGGVGSSGYRNAALQAGTDLEALLSGQRAQFGQQERGLQQSALANLLGLGLKTPFENIYQQNPPTFTESLAGGLGGGIGSLLAWLPRLLMGGF